MEIGGRDQEGLETHDLKFKNISLLGKWDFKVLSQDEIWQTLLWKKSCRLTCIVTCILETRCLGLLEWPNGDEKISYSHMVCSQLGIARK
jgi:hypothetical protein